MHVLPQVPIGVSLTIHTVTSLAMSSHEFGWTFQAHCPHPSNYPTRWGPASSGESPGLRPACEEPNSPFGSRHLLLWVAKRPANAARFVQHPSPVLHPPRHIGHLLSALGDKCPAGVQCHIPDLIDCSQPSIASHCE